MCARMALPLSFGRRVGFLGSPAEALRPWSGACSNYLASFAADPVSLRVRRQAHTAPLIPVRCGDRLRLRRNQADERIPAARIKRLEESSAA